MSSNSKKPGSSGSAIKKKVANEPCMLRFCSECLEKHYKESWGAIKKSNKYLYHFQLQALKLGFAQCVVEHVFVLNAIVKRRKKPT